MANAKAKPPPAKDGLSQPRAPPRGRLHARDKLLICTLNLGAYDPGHGKQLKGLNSKVWFQMQERILAGMRQSHFLVLTEINPNWFSQVKHRFLATSQVVHVFGQWDAIHHGHELAILWATATATRLEKAEIFYTFPESECRRKWWRRNLRELF